MEGESEEDVDRASTEADAVGLRPQQNVEIEGRLAHVYISGRRPMGVDLVVRFAPSRTGVVLAAFFAAMLAAGLATSFYYWREQMVGSNIDAAVAVLILVPALIGYVVIRPSDHPLTRRYVSGTQVLSLLASAIPLAMAALLLRFAESSSDLTTAWLWAMRGSWLIVLLLALSWLGTWLPRQEADPAEH